jgi:hypothetical protein
VLLKSTENHEIENEQLRRTVKKSAGVTETVSALATG